MKWLSQMFKEKSDVDTLTPDSTVDQSVNCNRLPVLVNLFVDHEPPVPEQLRFSEPPEGINIQLFLEQNFFDMGYKDGFDYHSPDTLTEHIKYIKADFRIKLDLLIDLKRRKILELENQNIEVESMSDRISRQIRLLINDLTATMDRLEKEKELSSADEGWIMKAIHSYREGFSRGFEIYNDERLLGISTGLFN